MLFEGCCAKIHYCQADVRQNEILQKRRQTERFDRIKNESQIKTWMRWYRSNEHYRFDQPIGKQYTYGHGPDSASEDDKRERQMSHLKMENEILKKYMEIERELRKK